MKRLLASVAISALALSGAAFAADAPTAVQKDQAPMAQTTNPVTTQAKPSTADSRATTAAKPSVDDSHAKKPAKKSDKSSMRTLAAPSKVQQAQAPATSTPAKPAVVDDSHAKKPAVVKKSDNKASTGTESAQPTVPAKPATR